MGEYIEAMAEILFLHCKSITNANFPFSHFFSISNHYFNLISTDNGGSDNEAITLDNTLNSILYDPLYSPPYIGEEVVYNEYTHALISGGDEDEKILIRYSLIHRLFLSLEASYAKILKKLAPGPGFVISFLMI